MRRKRIEYEAYVHITISVEYGLSDRGYPNGDPGFDEIALVDLSPPIGVSNELERARVRHTNSGCGHAKKPMPKPIVHGRELDAPRASIHYDNATGIYTYDLHLLPRRSGIYQIETNIPNCPEATWYHGDCMYRGSMETMSLASVNKSLLWDCMCEMGEIIRSHRSYLLKSSPDLQAV